MFPKSFAKIQDGRETGHPGIYGPGLDFSGPAQDSLCERDLNFSTIQDRKTAFSCGKASNGSL